MAGDIVSLETIDFYAPRFEIKVDDKKLYLGTSEAIRSVEVTEKVTDGASSTLTIHDNFDLSSQKFKYLDDENPLFDIGKKINIKMGYGNNLHDVFKGTITRIEPSFFADDTLTTFTVEAHAFSHDFIKRKVPFKEYKNVTFSDVAKTLATDAKLDSIINEDGELQKYIRKDNNVTYFEFLKDIAKQAKVTFYIDRNTLYFVKMDHNRKEILTLELGRDIINFHPHIKTTKLLTEVEVRWSNFKNPLEPITCLVKAGDEPGTEFGTKTGSQLAKEKVGDIRKVITCRALNSPVQAQKIAETELLKANSTLIEGTGECLGIAQIRPGVQIGLEKVGNRFSGNYYVTGSTHTMNDSGYRTHFTVMRTSLNTNVNFKIKG
jgi:uncharacterized protein